MVVDLIGLMQLIFLLNAEILFLAKRILFIMQHFEDDWVDRIHVVIFIEILSFDFLHFLAYLSIFLKGTYLIYSSFL